MFLFHLVATGLDARPASEGRQAADEHPQHLRTSLRKSLVHSSKHKGMAVFGSMERKVKISEITFSIVLFYRKLVENLLVFVSKFTFELPL